MDRRTKDPSLVFFVLVAVLAVMLMFPQRARAEDLAELPTLAVATLANIMLPVADDGVVAPTELGDLENLTAADDVSWFTDSAHADTFQNATIIRATLDPAPLHAIEFRANGGEIVGTVTWDEGGVHFDGDVDTSARLFFEAMVGSCYRRDTGEEVP